MPVALILVDALSLSYVATQTLPTLGDLTRGGYSGPLANIYAYRGIEATLFSGLFPDGHGVWGEFRPAPAPPAPEAVADRLARLAIGLGDCFPSDRLRLDLRYVVSRVRLPNQHLPTSNLIPARFIRSFTSSVDTPLWEARSLGAVPTLFDELREQNRPFATVVYPVVHHDREVVDRVAHRLRSPDRPDFWYIKFSALDALGHKYGPDVARLAPALRTLDGQLAELIAVLRAGYAGGDLDIVVLADHGMSRVERTIDARPILDALDLVPGRDYLYFLDSTTIRFWTANPVARLLLEQAFRDVPGLRLLDARARQALHLPDDPGTGDLLFALGEGYAVFPDFFRRETPPAGMHGYAEVRTQAGLPFLAASRALAARLPGARPLTHADVWAAMRERLGLAESSLLPEHSPLCTSSY